MADFQAMVVGLRNGAVLSQLNERLFEVLSAVKSTEKSGALVVTIKVSPAAKGKGGGEVVVIEADVKAKLPQPDLGKTVFFTDENFNLLRRDPRQLQLTEDEKGDK